MFTHDGDLWTVTSVDQTWRDFTGDPNALFSTTLHLDSVTHLDPTDYTFDVPVTAEGDTLDLLAEVKPGIDLLNEPYLEKHFSYRQIGHATYPKPILVCDWIRDYRSSEGHAQPGWGPLTSRFVDIA